MSIPTFQLIKHSKHIERWVDHIFLLVEVFYAFMLIGLVLMLDTKIEPSHSDDADHDTEATETNSE